MGKLKVFDGSQWVEVIGNGLAYSDAQVRAVLGASLAAGDNIILTPNAVSGVITIDVAPHSHPISDVTNLQSTLDSKADTTHTHGSDYISGGSWLTGTATRMPIPIAITGGKAYNNLEAAGSGGDFGTSEAVARADHTHSTVYAPFDHNHAFISAAVFTIDGADAPITTGIKGDLYFPFGAVITGWTLLGDRTGSISISVWKDSYANYPPTVVDDICGSETPTISSSTKGQDLNLSTWTPLINSGDTLRINVNSVTNIQRATLILHLYKTTN